MPSPSKKGETKASEGEPMEVDSTVLAEKTAHNSTVQTPKRKKDSQPKINSFFGSAAKVKKEVDVEDGDKKIESSASKTQKKEEMSHRKSGGGKKNEKEKEKKEEKETTKGKNMKIVRVKEEPMEEEKEEEEEEEEEDDGEPEYEVEKIVSHFWEDEVLKYKVRWVGYAPEEDTFEPESALESAKLKVDEYLRNLPPKAREEFETKMNRKIGSPSKGGKKRPISETIPFKSIKKENETKEDKKKKKDEKKKSKGGETASTSSSISKEQKSKKSEKKIKREVKDEPMDIEEGIKKINETKQKAYELATDDHIGNVIQKATMCLITMMRTGADPEKVAVANESLKSEHSVSIKADKTLGMNDPLRDLAYKMCSSLENALDYIVAREIRLKAEVKKEVDSPKKKRGEVDGSLFAISQVGTEVGIDVKEEQETTSQVKTEES